MILDVEFQLSHYVDWDFNGKNTSHLRFLQKPFILDVCKPLKKNWNFLGWTSKISPSIRFEIAWTSRTNLKRCLVYNINYLSIWTFMSHPCFPTEKVSKVAFFLSELKNNHEKKPWLFTAERGKLLFQRPFQWECKDNAKK